MTKYAVFDEKGLPKGFYDDGIHSVIPDGAVEITEEQWLEFINNQGRRKWDFETKQVVPYDPADDMSIDELRQSVIRQVKAIRRQKEQEGVVLITTNGKRLEIGATPNDKINIVGAVNAYAMGILPQDAKQKWDFRHSQVVEVGYEALVEIGGKVLQYIQALFDAQARHIAEIEQITDREELKNYDVNKYWPNNEFTLEKL